MVPQDPEDGVGQPGSEALLTYAQVAAELHVKKGTLFYWVSQGLIPHIRLAPRTVRFRREDLRRWLEGHAARPGSQP